MNIFQLMRGKLRGLAFVALAAFSFQPVLADGLYHATTPYTTNLAGGAAGQIPYQSAASSTSWLSAGNAGQLLLGNGASAPVWSTAGAAGQILVGNGAAAPAWSAAGNAGQILAGNGAAAPTWVPAGTAGQMLQSNGAAAPTWVAAATGIAKYQIITGGGSQYIDFLNIVPSTAVRVTIVVTNSVMSSGLPGAAPILQLGTAGGFDAGGNYTYAEIVNNSGALTATTSNTQTGFGVITWLATNASGAYGTIVLTRDGAGAFDDWTISTTGYNGVISSRSTGGAKSLGQHLTSIRLNGGAGITWTANDLITVFVE